MGLIFDKWLEKLKLWYVLVFGYRILMLSDSLTITTFLQLTIAKLVHILKTYF